MAMPQCAVMPRQSQPASCWGGVTAQASPHGMWPPPSFPQQHTPPLYRPIANRRMPVCTPVVQTLQPVVGQAHHLHRAQSMGEGAHWMQMHPHAEPAGREINELPSQPHEMRRDGGGSRTGSSHERRSQAAKASRDAAIARDQVDLELAGDYWKKDTLPARKMVTHEVGQWLDTALHRVERIILGEEKRRRAAERRAEEAVQREAERREAQRKRDEMKRERELQKEVLVCVEKLVRKVEKEHGREESGQPYVDGKASKSGTLKVLFKVHGAPCVEFLDCAVPESARNAEGESTMRAARQLETRAKEAKVRPSLAVLPTLTWVPPPSKGRHWSIICLQRSIPIL